MSIIDNKTITITFGECAENHKGMQMIGTLAEKGFTHNDLLAAKQKFQDFKCQCELINLFDSIQEFKIDETKIKEQHLDNAYILIVRNGVQAVLDTNYTVNDLFTEQNQLEVDKKAFMYGHVVNKHARHNLCFDTNSQEPDYENGKGRIVAFNDVPVTNCIRNHLPDFLGSKAQSLKGEGNYYYDVKTTGIGYHGDTERKIVIALRLGASLSLHYSWFLNNKPIGENMKFILNHGDLYIMSQKSTGQDWKRSSIYTLRHAAGCKKYTDLDHKKTNKRKANNNTNKWNKKSK